MEEPHDESLEDVCNVSLIEDQLLRLRHEDPTQYTTLVKMHLSFTTDLPLASDTLDGGSTSGSSGGGWRQLAPLARWLGGGGRKAGNEATVLPPHILQLLLQIIRFLSAFTHVTTEGIFRKCGSSSRQVELHNQLSVCTTSSTSDSPALLSSLDVTAVLSAYSTHDVASLLKSLLAELPEPLLQDQNFTLHCKLAEVAESFLSASQRSRRIKALQLLLLLLPRPSLELLRALLMLLHTVAQQHEHNRMSCCNLGMVFAPHILCPRKMSGSDLQQHSAVAANAVTFMVKHAPKLFQVPVELECDVKQYWMNRSEAASNMLDHQHSRSLHHTTTSCSPSPSHSPTLARTIFSFVDHSSTQAAGSRETTALALAELYAHVSTMPDSDQKRRLVRQFNAASGCGTPRYTGQGRTAGRAAAIAHTIKKHLWRAGGRRGAGHQETVEDGRGGSKKCGSYSPNRACAPEGGRCLRLCTTPNTPSLACTHRHTLRHTQQVRAKSWDNLTTPKNLRRKCLFPSPASSPFFRKKQQQTSETTEKIDDTGECPADAYKLSKSCTALCSECSKHAVNTFQTYANESRPQNLTAVNPKNCCTAANHISECIASSNDPSAGVIAGCSNICPHITANTTLGQNCEMSLNDKDDCQKLDAASHSPYPKLEHDSVNSHANKLTLYSIGSKPLVSADSTLATCNHLSASGDCAAYDSHTTSVGSTTNFTRNQNTLCSVGVVDNTHVSRSTCVVSSASIASCKNVPCSSIAVGNVNIACRTSVVGTPVTFSAAVVFSPAVSSAHLSAQSPASPLATAMMHDTITQASSDIHNCITEALVLTPRSRRPIVSSHRSSCAALALHNTCRSEGAATSRDGAGSGFLEESTSERQVQRNSQEMCVPEMLESSSKEDVRTRCYESGRCALEELGEVKAAERGRQASSDGAVLCYSATAGTTDGQLPETRTIGDRKNNTATTDNFIYAHSETPNEHVAVENISIDVKKHNVKDKSPTSINRKQSHGDWNILEIPKKDHAGGSMLSSESRHGGVGLTVSNLSKSVRRSLSRRLSKSKLRTAKQGRGDSWVGGEKTTVLDNKRQTREVDKTHDAVDGSCRSEATAISPLNDFHTNCSPVARQQKQCYSSSTSEALGSFFKHLSSSSLAQIAQRLKTYNEADLNVSYKMLSPIESDTSCMSVSSVSHSPVRQADQSLTLVFREYLERRGAASGSNTPDTDECSSLCTNSSEPLDAKTCSAPLLDIETSEERYNSVCGEVDGRSVSCGAIDTLMSLPPQGRALNDCDKDVSKHSNFSVCVEQLSESLLMCLDGRNPLSMSWDATDSRQHCAAPVVPVLPSGRCRDSYRSAVNLGRLLSPAATVDNVPVSRNIKAIDCICDSAKQKENRDPLALTATYCKDENLSLSTNERVSDESEIHNLCNLVSSRLRLIDVKSEQIQFGPIKKINSAVSSETYGITYSSPMHISNNSLPDFTSLNPCVPFFTASLVSRPSTVTPPMVPCSSTATPPMVSPPSTGTPLMVPRSSTATPVLPRSSTASPPVLPRSSTATPPVLPCSSTATPPSVSSSPGTRVHRVLGARHGTPKRATPRGTAAPYAKVHFHTAM